MDRTGARSTDRTRTTTLALLAVAVLAWTAAAEAGGGKDALAQRGGAGDTRETAPDAQMLLDLDLLKEPDFATQRDLAKRMRLIERIRLLEHLRVLEGEPESAPAKSGGPK